ncbi:unnamed protein product [Cyclocybe aegerita]|uniref:Rsm22-domain-containing protein n=1 Tax=Cyclocybe aegerita TaxID=1973307 RepID=A0A8S0WKP3_CYCAE|nr:unnamed protein product [Cyclocybe aegerita]
MTPPLFSPEREGTSKMQSSAGSTQTGVWFNHVDSSVPKTCPIPHPPLNLDPSLQTLLRDIDISIKSAKKHGQLKHRELEIVTESSTSFSNHLAIEEWAPLETSDELEEVEREDRKSPAAAFGSNSVGSVILPIELQSSINILLSESDKSMLRSDVKRLFHHTEGTEQSEWDTAYDKEYRSRKQASRHALRDGTAFATVALPAHYSAITSVLHHVKLRMEPGWEIEQVMDWGAGTGSGLWASLYSFQQPSSSDNVHDKTAMTSKITSYVAIDKRDGLVAIGKKLVDSTPTGALKLQWQRTFREENILLQEDGPKAMALSAFMLTTLPTSVAQKNLVKEMWDSGAHTIVLIDHNTPEGFRAIAHAREYILELGQAELEDAELATEHLCGSHVLAPCPHDGACPLLRSGGHPLICGFSQRIQRPSFVQKTKQSKVGHEDVEYSYVVIQRGARPGPVGTSVGRIGGIGRRQFAKETLAAPMKELKLHDEGEPVSASSSSTEATELVHTPGELSEEELQKRLRQEAYQWPRLVFPPLKKSGHIILDSCTSEGKTSRFDFEVYANLETGKIMRLTIPKSQGKQPYYDARKSSWGDIFPHPPKNPPLERYQPSVERKGGAPSAGGDIGKRKGRFKNRDRPSYTVVAESLREKRKMSKRDYQRHRGEKVWTD